MGVSSVVTEVHTTLYFFWSLLCYYRTYLTVIHGILTPENTLRELFNFNFICLSVCLNVCGSHACLVLTEIRKEASEPLCRSKSTILFTSSQCSLPLNHFSRTFQFNLIYMPPYSNDILVGLFVNKPFEGSEQDPESISASQNFLFYKFVSFSRHLCHGSGFFCFVLVFRFLFVSLFVWDRVSLFSPWTHSDTLPLSSWVLWLAACATLLG